MSKKIRVDSDRYVYFSIQVSLSISTVDGVFFFFSFQLFSGIRRIRKELEKVLVRNNHDKLETLINSDTPKKREGVKVTSRGRCDISENQKALRIFPDTYAHTHTLTD